MKRVVLYLAKCAAGGVLSMIVAAVVVELASRRLDRAQVTW